MDIKCLKKFFWIAFAISLILMLISCLILLLGYDQFSNWAVNMYRLTPYEFSRLFVYSMSFWKILIFQFTFVPALALTILDRNR